MERTLWGPRFRPGLIVIGLAVLGGLGILLSL